MSNITIEDIKNKHRGGWTSLFKLVSKHSRILKSIQLWGALSISILFTILIIIVKKDDIFLYSLIGIILNQNLTILPTILGFTMTAFVLLIGFSNNEYMDSITDQNDQGYSFFQHIVSIFAWCCIVQSVTLCISYGFNVIHSLNMSCPLYNYINMVVIFLLIFAISYSLLLIVRLTLNVFQFAQTLQFHFVIKKILKARAEEEQKQKDREQEKGLEQKNPKGILMQLIEIIWKRR